MKLVRPLLLLLGVAFAAGIAYRQGPGLLMVLARVGWAFPLLLLASGAAYLLHTWAWGMVFRSARAPVSLPVLYGIRLAGEAVNKAAPLASMGGEPVKAFLLVQRGTPGPDAAASVMLSKAVMTVAQGIFILTALGIAVATTPAVRPVAWAFAVFPVFVLVSLGAAAVLEKRHADNEGVRVGNGGMGEWENGRDEPERVSSEFPNSQLPTPNSHPATGPAWLKPLRETWRSCDAVMRERPQAFWQSLVVVLAGWSLNSLELLGASWLIGRPLDPLQALALEGMVAAVNMASFFIPANAGSQEGAFAYVTPMLGLDPASGLGLAAIRRGRDLIWILLGLGLLVLWEGTSWRKATSYSLAEGSTAG